MVLSDPKLSVNRAAFASGQTQVQTGGMFRPATEATAVVRAQLRSGRWGIEMTDRGGRMIRRISTSARCHDRTLPTTPSPMGARLIPWSSFANEFAPPGGLGC